MPIIWLYSAYIPIQDLCMPYPSILALGEAMIEFNQTVAGEPAYRQGFGGDTSNFAIAAARQGAASGYLSIVGDDKFGQALRALWKTEGVDTLGVRTDPHAHTGVYFVTHDETGHSFSYLRAGSAASCMLPSDLHTTLLNNAGFLHVSGISQAISPNACDTVFAAIEMARRAGAKISYDANLRLKLWPLARARAIIRATVGLCDYFLPSIEDAQQFTGLDTADAILDWCFDAGARAVLLKLGKDGVIVATKVGRRHIPGLTVHAVDATGAGDCFAGALIARLSFGDDLHTAARYANAAAALTTTGYGAVEPIPRREQVEALLCEAA
jgi:2-dehydro-3-deoxygluconokinase